MSGPIWQAAFITDISRKIAWKEPIAVEDEICHFYMKYEVSMRKWLSMNRIVQLFVSLTLFIPYPCQAAGATYGGYEFGKPITQSAMSELAEDVLRCRKYGYGQVVDIERNGSTQTFVFRCKAPLFGIPVAGDTVYIKVISGMFDQFGRHRSSPYVSQCDAWGDMLRNDNIENWFPKSWKTIGIKLYGSPPMKWGIFQTGNLYMHVYEFNKIPMTTDNGCYGLLNLKRHDTIYLFRSTLLQGSSPPYLR